MCVPEVGRQDRQAPLGVFAVSIPAQQSLEGKSVAKIVQARASTAPRSTQSNLSRQYVEHPVDLAFVQSVAILIHEKVRLCSRAKASVPPFGVIGQDLTGRRMQRYQTGLAKLCSPNGEDASRPVQILGMEIHGFTEPEACDCQQSKESSDRSRAAAGHRKAEL